LNMFGNKDGRHAEHNRRNAPQRQRSEVQHPTSHQRCQSIEEQKDR
jgi:hypothetical protein